MRAGVAALVSAGQAGYASILRCAWWEALAELDWDVLPGGVYETLSGLEPGDRERIIEAWSNRLPLLRGRRSDRELLDRMREVARGRMELEVEVELGAILRDLTYGRRGVPRTLVLVEELVTSGTARPKMREAMVRAVLDHADRLDASAVIELLSKSRDLPSAVRVVLEQRILPELLEDARSSPWPPLASLASRETLAMTMAEDLGRRAPAEPGPAVAFCREAARRKRYDLIARLLDRCEPVLPGRRASFICRLSEREPKVVAALARAVGTSRGSALHKWRRRIESEARRSGRGISGASLRGM